MVARFLQSFITTLLIFSFVFIFPQTPAFAKNYSDAYIAFEVYEKKGAANLAELRQALHQKIFKEKNLYLIPQEFQERYEEMGGIKNDQINSGERNYLEAEDRFKSAARKSPYDYLNKAIKYLSKKPGTFGFWQKAYFLKSMLDMESGNITSVRESLKKAALLNLDNHRLDAYDFSPQVRLMYQKILKETQKKVETIPLHIQVKGATNETPIFVNGIRRGFGKNLTVQVPKGRTQFVSAGRSLKAQVYSVSGSEITVHAKDLKKTVTDNAPFRIYDVGDGLYISVVQNKAELAHATKAVILRNVDLGKEKLLQVSVMDVVDVKVTKPKNITWSGSKKEYNKVIDESLSYIKGLKKRDYVDPTTIYDKVTVVKKGKMNKVLIGVGAAVLIGAAVGIAAGMSGGSSSSSGPGSATTSVSGPSPIVP